MGSKTRIVWAWAALSLAVGCGSSSQSGNALDAKVDGGDDANASVSPTLATWSSATPMPGTPIAYTRTVALGNRLFVLAGRTLNTDAGPGEPALGVYAYDPATGQWAEHASLPLSIDQPNIAAVGDKIYVLGGTGVREIFEYEPGTFRWMAKGMHPAVEGIGAAAVAVLATKIYLAGGVIPSLSNPRGARIPDFFAYDTATETWETLPPMVEESGYFGAAIIGGALYTVGGSTEKRDVARPGKTFAYDVAARTWTERAPALVAVSSFANADLNGKIYLIGGIAGATGRINPETQVYDPKTDVWTTTTSMPFPRFAMAAAVLRGKVYVPGGVQQVGEAEFVAVTSVDVLGP